MVRIRLDDDEPYSRRVYMWVDDTTMASPGGGGGGGVASSATDPTIKWKIDLPATVGDAKTRGLGHSDFGRFDLSDDFRFSQWCVLVPRKYPLGPANKGNDPSAFLEEHRQAFGASLPENMLLVTKVTENGAVDTEFAAEIQEVLGYQDDQMPLLVFTPRPKLEVRSEYKNVALLDLHDSPIDAVTVSLGKCNEESVRRFIEGLPSILSSTGPSVAELELLQESAIAGARKAAIVEFGKTHGRSVTGLISLGSAAWTVLKNWPF